MKRYWSMMVAGALLWLAVPMHETRAQEGRRWCRGNVDQVLRRLEEHSDRFSKSLDAALDRSRLDGSNREDNINQFVHEFEEATDRLKDRYEDRGFAPGATREVMTRAARIDQFMRRHKFGGRAESDWRAIRRDLNQLARSYGVSWRW